MSSDPIIDEVRRTRDEHARSFNYDLRAIFQDIKRRERESGLTYTSRPPRLLKNEERQERDRESA